MDAEIDAGLAPFIALLARPSPDRLWRLRDELYALGLGPEAPIWPCLDDFYHFLNELGASATAREYSHFASLLDIGAVGGVAIQNLLAENEARTLWRRVLAGGLSESLMVMAARQYVKAWEGELSALYRSAAWNLHHHLWQLSLALRPELAHGTRRSHLEQLLVPLREEKTGGTVKAVLIARLYQLLLLTHLYHLGSGGNRS